MRVGDRLFADGAVRVVTALGEMAFEHARVGVVWTRPARKDEITDDDREQIASGQRVTRAMRERVTT